MSQPPRVMGVLAACRNPQALAAAAQAVDWLQEQEVEVRLEPPTAAALDRPAPADEGWLQGDLLLVFGGDGTVISALRAAAATGVPVIGVNFGTVGFLTEIPATDLRAALSLLIAGRYEIDRRLMLQTRIASPDGTIHEAMAANDVVVKASDPTHVLEFRVRADERLIAEFPADGLIVSTPTGSTAYNLSAGGPVVVPELPAILVTPICPHSLAMRAVVLSAETHVTVEVEAVGRNRQAVAAVDGRVYLDLEPGATLEIQRASQPMVLARLPATSFFDSLRGKLRWGKPK